MSEFNSKKKTIGTGPVLFCCLALSMQLLELIQTRVLSVLYYSSYVYAIAALTLMGFGIGTVCGGIFIRRWQHPRRIALLCACFFALTPLIAIRITSLLPLLFPHGDLKSVFVASVVLAVPFMIAGFAASSILEEGIGSLPLLFFAFFSGRAVGTLLFSNLLTFLGADSLLWLSSGIILAGCVLYTAGLRLNVGLVGLFVVCFGAAAVFWHGGLIEDTAASYKYEHILRRNGAKEYSLWTPVGKTDIWSTDDPVRKVISLDGGVSSWSLLAGFGSSRTDGAVESPYSLPYIIRPEPAEVLLISPAGGEEIVRARSFGARHITGIEMHPGLFNLLHTRYAGFAQWSSWENVTLHNETGRGFLEKSGTSYDIISINFDTLTALSTGPYVSAENYLYTVDAVRAYLASLSPEGILFFCRLLCNPPREGLRLANLYLYAADTLGISKPSQCMLVICWYFHPTTWAATLLKKEAFTAAEVDAVLQIVKSRRDLAAVYIPDIFPAEKQKRVETDAFSYQADDLSGVRSAYHELIAAGTWQKRREFEEAYAYNIAPVYDDSPFFFECHKVREMFSTGEIFHWWSRGTIVHYVLFSLCVLSLLLVMLCAALPGCLNGSGGLSGIGLFPQAIFFSALGFGFSFICISIMQRLSVYLGYENGILGIVLPQLYVCISIGCLYAGSTAGGKASFSRQQVAVTVAAALTSLLLLWFLFPAALALQVWLHGALIMIFLLPVGFLFGSTLLVGYAQSNKKAPPGWAFGMYSLSVAGGTALCVTIAMRVGFSTTLIVGYAVCVVCAVLAVRRACCANKRITNGDQKL